MSNQRDTDLDTFEAALLSELSQPDSSRLGRAVGLAARRRRTRWQVAGWAAAAAAAAAVLLMPVLLPTPAYAVTGRNNGEVHVKVNRLEGADELEQALQQHGITADITYLPPNKMCADGRYAAVRTPGLSLAISTYKFEVTIPPGGVAKGDTFVLDASVMPLRDGLQARVHFDIAEGTVAPCEVIDEP